MNLFQKIKEYVSVRQAAEYYGLKQYRNHMYYHCDNLDLEKLKICMDSYIFSDEGMRENSMSDIIKRVERVFQNSAYKQRVAKSDKCWIDEPINAIFSKIIDFLKGLE